MFNVSNTIKKGSSNGKCSYKINLSFNIGNLNINTRYNINVLITNKCNIDNSRVIPVWVSHPRYML